MTKITIIGADRIKEHFEQINTDAIIAEVIDEMFFEYPPEQPKRKLFNTAKTWKLVNGWCESWSPKQ